MNDSGAANESDAEDTNTDSAAQPGESEGMADINNEDVQQASETLDDGVKAEAFEEGLEIKALEATTSIHDDWLHRGPFLFDMDFHTYLRFTVRMPRPKKSRLLMQRALSTSFFSNLTTHLQHRIGNSWSLRARKACRHGGVKWPSPILNKGEDDAVFSH